jgi:tRNA G18 (ribose-2'-O)-methylase SpoU
LICFLLETTGSDMSTEQENISLQITLVLDRLRSAFNTGNIFRLAEGTAVKEILCCSYTPSPPHPRLEKTAKGTDKTVPFRNFEKTVDAVRALKQEGVHVVAVEAVEDSPFVWDYPFTFPLALVLGNEALGVDEEVLKECDGVVRLPMLGEKSSVNVANCAAAVLYNILEHYQYRKDTGS